MTDLFKYAGVALEGRLKKNKNGRSLHPAYKRWSNMVSRCHNPRTPCFKDYGGRGIFVCDEWRYSSEAFISWADSNGFKPGLQIDRIDNDGPYSPENCRFVTQAENLKNQRPLKDRANAVLLADGALLIDAIAARGLNRMTVWSRMMRRGMTPDEALNYKRGPRLSDGRKAVDVAAENGVSDNLFRVRVIRGWPVDLAATLPVGSKKPPSQN